jgi:glutaryl-CoA dehydrogenase
MTTDDIGRARGTDYFLIAEQLTESEMDYLLRARQFVDHDGLPVLNRSWERAEGPGGRGETLA